MCLLARSPRRAPLTAIWPLLHTPGHEWLTWDEYHRQVAPALGAPEPELVHIPTDVLERVAPRHAGVVVDNFRFNEVFE